LQLRLFSQENEEDDWQLAELRIGMAHYYANPKNKVYVEAPQLGRIYL
jgi:hypothetical protein